MMKPILYCSLLLVILSCCLEIRRASEIQFQTLEMNLQYLSSSSVCNRAHTTGFNNMASTLEVVHRYGSCAQTDKNRPINIPSFAQTLANDQLGVKFIQARAVKNDDSINTNKSRWDKRAQIPTSSGKPFHTGDYFVNIGLGTPKQRLSLIFGTATELMWTQCKPCAGIGTCYQQKDPIFNPNHSSSYSNISCNAKKCSQLYSAISGEPGCSSGTCAYIIEYGDKSFTAGLFAKEKLTVTPTDVFQDFLFGCGHNNTGLFGQIDGILGLGRDPVSFVSQTAKKYDEYFSYCLPPTINSTGFLAFGKNNKVAKKDDDDDETMIFTPFVTPPAYTLPIFYFIEITTISVGRKRLAISRSVFTTAGAIIDSGTVITRLPPVAYNKMSIEFKRQMKELNYTSAPAFSILDTCYYISQHMSTIKIPTMSFTFKGNATINLDAFGILYTINSTYACLAFAGNSDPEDLAIFGNTQQKTFEVAYDVARGKLGFAPNKNCQ